MPSRSYYSAFREGGESISAYVQLAKRTLSMVSINLATGVDMENVVDAFTAMICHRPDPVKIRVSLLNPDNDALMWAIAPVLGRTPANLAVRITDALDVLDDFADNLPAKVRSSFTLSCHNALPQASAIMIDEGTSDGLIQLESKPYVSAFTKSFAWEVGAGTEFYETLRESYAQLIAHGEVRSGQPW
jgi:hypothetical protein